MRHTPPVAIDLHCRVQASNLDRSIDGGEGPPDEEGAAYKGDGQYRHKDTARDNGKNHQGSTQRLSSSASREIEVDSSCFPNPCQRSCKVDKFAPVCYDYGERRS